LALKDQRTWIISFYCKPSKIQPYESDSSQEIVLCSTYSPIDFNSLHFEDKSTQRVAQAPNNEKRFHLLLLDTCSFP